MAFGGAGAESTLAFADVKLAVIEVIQPVEAGAIAGGRRTQGGPWRDYTQVRRCHNPYASAIAPTRTIQAQSTRVSSTRRLCARPSSVSFVSLGRDLP